MTEQSCFDFAGKTDGSFSVVACRLHYKTGFGPKTLLHAWSLGYTCARRSAYGERKTARILTVTPNPVNTANRPASSRVPVILLGSGKFKQTFVLDPPSGVDIMRGQDKAV